MAVSTEFDFKVQTVRWFGILSALVILLMIGLGFFYLDRILSESAAYQSQLNFQEYLKREKPGAEIVTIGLEHEALSMRNKRTVSALYMRAYSQFLAIIAGSVLALLGAIFVLARVDNVETENQVGWGQATWVLKSASPGIIVTVVGAVLIASVVFISGKPITANDGSLFLAQGRASIAPPPVGEAAQTFKQKMEQDLKMVREKGEAAK